MRRRMKIIEYKIVEPPYSPGILDDAVNEHIKQGWVVFGYPHFVEQYDSVHPGFYYQAMVKYATEDPSVIESLKEQNDYLLSALIEAIKPFVGTVPDSRGLMYTYQDISIYKRNDSITQFCPFTVIAQCVADREKNKVRNENS